MLGWGLLFSSFRVWLKLDPNKNREPEIVHPCVMHVTFQKMTVTNIVEKLRRFSLGLRIGGPPFIQVGCILVDTWSLSPPVDIKVQHLNPVLDCLQTQHPRLSYTFNAIDPVPNINDKATSAFYPKKMDSWGLKAGSWNLLEASHGIGAPNSVRRGL